VRKAYADMGILGFADVDLDALSGSDEKIAAQLDGRISPEEALGIKIG
jgi:hypothetical protein